MDRAHRLGQRAACVNVYRILTRGTVEERMMSLQRFKVDFRFVYATHRFFCMSDALRFLSICRLRACALCFFQLESPAPIFPFLSFPLHDLYQLPSARTHIALHSKKRVAEAVVSTANSSVQTMQTDKIVSLFQQAAHAQLAARGQR